MSDDILGAIDIPSIMEPEGVLAMWVRYLQVGTSTVDID